MKKLLSLSMLSYCLFFSACEADNISKIKFGVKAISNCYNSFSLPNKGAGSAENVKEVSLKKLGNSDISLMPAYSWDPKMLVW